MKRGLGVPNTSTKWILDSRDVRVLVDSVCGVQTSVERQGPFGVLTIAQLVERETVIG